MGLYILLKPDRIYLDGRFLSFFEFICQLKLCYSWLNVGGMNLAKRQDVWYVYNVMYLVKKTINVGVNK